MKYDPIMCMMVDDSVKTEDASWKAWSLYIDGKFVKSFNSEMPPIKEAKEYMKENHPDKVAKLSRNTGSSSGYVISSRDSKTIDHAIRSCDASTGRKVVVYVENYLRSIGKNNSTGKYDRIVHGVKNLLNESLLEDDKLKNAAEKEAKRLLEKYGM